MKAVGGSIDGLVLLMIMVLLGGGDPGIIFNDGTNNNIGFNNPNSPYYEEMTPISEEERQLADFV